MGRRAPQAPSAGTWFGVPAGTRSAWWPRMSGAGPALSACPVLSSVRCPVSGVHASSVHACDVHATGVQRPGVRCPVWASGVRCPVGRPGLWASGVRYPGVPRLLCPNRVSSSSAPMRRAATRRGRPEVGVVAPHGIHDRLVVCPSRSLTLEAGAGRAGPTEASAWPWSSGGPRPAAGLDRLADQEEPVAQGPLVGREPGTRRGSPTCGMAGRRSSGT
jgi:hypothetical protein